MPLNVSSSVRVGAIRAPIAAIDVALECLAADAERAFFASIEAPVDAAVAVSAFFPLAEKAQEFAVGQLAGSIKQVR